MSRDLGTPVLDNHLHLDPRHGRGMDAVDEFARSGGTHLLVVNKPSWHLGPVPADEADFRAVFDETIETVDAAADRLDGTAWPVLGVHPALVSQLVDDGMTPDEARDLMTAGLEVAAEYVADGPALALKSGRPHYDVEDAVWEASNAVLRRALELGAETGSAVQLHTESTEDLADVGDWAEAAGLPRERVVKHFAGGRLDGGVIPSVISRRDELEQAVRREDPFLMETDFIDDPDRPGAVLGPKTVPRRVKWLQEEGYHDAVDLAHVETPQRVYGIDTRGTLG